LSGLCVPDKVRQYSAHGVRLTVGGRTLITALCGQITSDKVGGLHMQSGVTKLLKVALKNWKALTKIKQN